MKISTVLTLSLVVVGTITIADFGYAAYHAAQNYQTVQKLRAMVVARGVWFDALTSLSSERSFSQVLLNSPQTGYDNIKTMRAQAIETTNGLIDQAQSQLVNLGEFDTQTELLGDIVDARTAIDGYRGEVDSWLDKPLESRDMAKVEALIDNIKAEITEMKGMAVHMITPNDVTPTSTILLSRLQESAFEIREYGGRARSIYAIATLLKAQVSEVDRKYAYTMIARALEAWAEVIHISETVPIPDSVKSQLDVVNKGFVQDFSKLVTTLNGKGDALRLANNDTPPATSETPSDTGSVDYGMSFADFFEASSASLKTATDLAKIVGLSLDDAWKEKADAQRREMIYDITAALAVAALAMFTLLVVSRKVTQRLAGGLADLAALTAGDLHRDVAHKKGDLKEIQLLSGALIDLQAQLRRADAAQTELANSEAAQKHVMSCLTSGLNNLAAGDLSQRITDRFDPKYQGLADDFNAATNALGNLVANVIETAKSILSGARGIAEATTELSQRTETQGVTLQNAAAALEQLTRNIVGSQADAKELDELAQLAKDKGQGMGATMAQTVAAMEAIKTSSQQIEQIVGVIEDIAFQTNLLALNAGVEATRAGVEGSGFAVIASEVRGLAERSAESAQGIKTLIAASGMEVAKGVDFVAEAEASSEDIGEHIQKISGLISRIAVAAVEQSQGLIKVNEGVSKLDLVTQTNVAMVEETTAECASLTAVAQDLSELVGRFQTTSASPEEIAEFGDVTQAA